MAGMGLLWHGNGNWFFRSQGPGLPRATLAGVQGLALSGASGSCSPTPSKDQGPFGFENQHFTRREGSRSNGVLTSSRQRPNPVVGFAEVCQPLPWAMRVSGRAQAGLVCPLLDNNWDQISFYRRWPALTPYPWVCTLLPSPQVLWHMDRSSPGVLKP